MVEVRFNLGKRDFVWIGIIVVLLGLGFGYAYVADGSGDPTVMGHSVGELESINWSQINNRPAGLDDGDDDTVSGIKGKQGTMYHNFGSDPIPSARTWDFTISTTFTPVTAICNVRTEQFAGGWWGTTCNVLTINANSVTFRTVNWGDRGDNLAHNTDFNYMIVGN